MCASYTYARAIPTCITEAFSHAYMLVAKYLLLVRTNSNLSMACTISCINWDVHIAKALQLVRSDVRYNDMCLNNF